MSGLDDLSRPDKFDRIMQMSPPAQEIQEQHSWNPEDRSLNIYVKDEDKLTFHRHRVVRSTDCIRGKIGYSSGFHVWQIEWQERQRGTHAVVGVSTKTAPLHATGYTTLVGTTDESYGWDITKRECHHDSKNTKPWRYPINKRSEIPDKFYCILDMDEGYMAFATDDEFLGIAFRNLKGKTLYPIVAAVWGHCEVSMRYRGSIEYEDKLTFHRYPVAQTTDCIRGKIGYSSGFHVWQIEWPEGQRGTHAVVGVATKSAPLHSIFYNPLIGTTEESYGWDITKRECHHDSQNTKPWRYPFDNSHEVPDKFYCILDMDEGYMAFATDDEFLGVAFRNLKGKILYPIVAAVWGHCEVSMRIPMTGREFTLKHQFDFEDVRKLVNFEKLNSPVEEHFGVKWTICISTYDDKGLRELRTNLDAHDLKNQEIQVDYITRIFSKNKEKTHTDFWNGTFAKNNCYRCCVIFMKTAEEEYLNDGILEVEICAKINTMIGFPRKELRSFGEEMKQFSDVVLKVEDRRFYVSKLYLASQSSYFATLLLGQFQESGQSEIELEDVNPDDFQCFLEILYAEDAVDDDTVEGVLKIADMFNTPLATKKCEKFLVGTPLISLRKKLELAETYKLEELKKICQLSI